MYKCNFYEAIDGYSVHYLNSEKTYIIDMDEKPPDTDFVKIVIDSDIFIAVDNLFSPSQVYFAQLYLTRFENFKNRKSDQ